MKVVLKFSEAYDLATGIPADPRSGEVSFAYLLTQMKPQATDISKRPCEDCKVYNLKKGGVK